MTKDRPILFNKDADGDLLLRKALRQDTQRLLADFISRRSYDWASFCAAWAGLDFSLVLVFRPEDHSPAWYMEALFEEALESLAVSENLGWRAGCVYLLYSLYRAQPLAEGSRGVRVPVSKRLWMHLVAMDQAALHTAEIADVHRLLVLLKREDAFSFVAMTHRETAEAYETYLVRTEHEASPLQVLEMAEDELRRVEQALRRDAGLAAPPALRQLQAVEEEYAVHKWSVLPHLQNPTRANIARADITRDLAQAQHDWTAAQFVTAAPGDGAGAASQAAGKRRRATVQEPVPRAQTAPPLPVPAETPDYLIHAEHMPSLF